MFTGKGITTFIIIFLCSTAMAGGDAHGLGFLNSNRLPASLDQSVINESFLGGGEDTVTPEFSQDPGEVRDIANLDEASLEPKKLPLGELKVVPMESKTKPLRRKR